MYFLPYLFLFPVLFVITVCIYFYYKVSCKVSNFEKSNMPFLRPTFPIGHPKFWNMRKKCIAYMIDQIYRENTDKDLVAFFITGLPFVLLRDPKLIQKVFVKSSDRAFCNGFRPLSTDIETQSMIFFASDKTQWKRGRKVLERFFTPSHMVGPIFGKFKTQIGKLWQYSEEARSEGRSIRVNDFAFNFVADCLASWSFSEETNSYEKREQLHEVVRYFFAHSHTRLITLLCQTQFPALQMFKACKIIPQKYIDFMRHFLEQKTKFRSETRTCHNDFIDHLMTFRHGDESTDTFKKETNMRQKTGYALAMLVTGVDTVSSVCTSVVHLLSLHPEHQDRIKREIDNAMKKHNVSELTFEVIQDLRFTEQCVYETLRLIPLNMFIMRLCSEDFQIPGTKYTLRKGDRVITVPYSIHRDSKYFSDPDKFDPERFSPENKAHFMAESFIPFGCGPRKCPGYKLGVLQVVLFVASIILKYEIKPRSHPKPMTAADFDPRVTFNLPREELLIDLVPRPTSTL